MALSPSDRAVVERWTGPIASGEEDSVDERSARLGGPEFAALEILMVARSAMRISATSISSDSDRSDHSRNLEALDGSVAELAAVIAADSDIAVSALAEKLLDSANGGGTSTVSTFDVVAESPRRG